MDKEVIMLNIPIESIIVDTRARKVFGSLDDLALSIKEDGIIQPVAVFTTGDGKYKLLAGERRLRAIIKLGTYTTIPARIYDRELTELEVRCIELAENLYRKNLEWIEEVELKRSIHELQVEIHGKKTSTAKGADGQSLRDTSRLLGESQALTARDVKLANMLRVMPELGKCKNKNEALKILEAVKKNITNERLAKQLSDTKATTPIETRRRALTECYIVEDFFAGIDKVPDQSVHLVEVDPPYGIDYPSLRKGGLVDTGLYNEISEEDYPVFLNKTLRESYRILKECGWLLIWFDIKRWWVTMMDAATAAGFDTKSIMPALWVKPEGGSSLRPELHLASNYETFLYLRKGEARINKPGRSNVFNFHRVAPQYKVHPTERPIEMMEEILKTFTPIGSRICVPFLGSGNTLLAANNLHMSGFGYDLTQQYKDHFTIRVHQGPPYKSYSTKL